MVSEREIVKGYQGRVATWLQHFFRDKGYQVEKEWDVAKNSMDAYSRLFYCPRIDIAIGPLNTDGKIKENNRRINKAYRHCRGIINKLKSMSNRRGSELNLNENPRCFLAIEIENTTRGKPLLGSIVNASAIGKIGIIIAWNEKVYKRLIRMEEYLKFLKRAKKMETKVSRNVLIIKKNNFSKFCKNYIKKAR